MLKMKKKECSINSIFKEVVQSIYTSEWDFNKILQDKLNLIWISLNSEEESYMLDG